MKIKCACGCGKKITQKDKYNRPHKFISGHNKRGHFSGKFIPCKVCKKLLYRTSYYLKKNKHFVCKKCFKHIVSFWSAGKNNYHWKGFFKMGSKNHIYNGLKKRNHPMADKQGRILEHRFVMSKKIGRILKKEEVVHHKNGNTLDNKPKNLILCKNSSEHIKKYHHKRRATPRPLPSCDSIKINSLL